MSISISITGLLSSGEYQQAKAAAEAVVGGFQRDVSAEITGLLEADWAGFISQQKTGRQDSWGVTEPVLITVDDALKGTVAEFVAWVAATFNIAADTYAAEFEAIGAGALRNHYNKDGSTFVFMDLTVDGAQAGRLVFELYTSVCPKTSENFMKLCTGEAGTNERGTALTYEGSVIHRIQERGWVQGGDIVSATGSAGDSVHGETFPDENFIVQHDGRGILSMANSGLHTNASQFNISFRGLPWMNQKYVAFGKVVEGSDVLAQLEGVPTASSGRPIADCKIASCGLLGDA